MINFSKILPLGASLLFALLLASACGESSRDTLAGDNSNTSSSDGDTDADNDADSDADSDGDSDGDSDSDGDADSDSDADSDGDADTDADSDADNDADADSDGDSDSDADSDTDADADGDSDSDSDSDADPCDGSSFEVKEGGYVCAGPMHGYAWVSSGDIAGASIQPSDFESLSGGESELCVAGNTAPDENWASVGILGMNVGQALEASDEGSFTPGSNDGGIDVDVSMNGEFGLRLQVKTTNGNEYCRSISNGSNSVSWSNLTMECWEPGGTAYNGSDPISSVMLLVPGDNESEVNYDFCMKDLDVGDGGSSDADSDTDADGDSDSDSDGDADGDSDSDSDSDYVPPTLGGQDGFATHYWDCCKASCGWSENAGGNPVESCDQNNNSFGGDYNQQSNCSGGGAFQCWGFHPRAINSKYAVGWAAFNSGGCNTCYQLEFTGQSNSGYDDPGAASLAGKVMIVQVINIGGIQGHQFDLLVPGGGVGDFNACSTQWGGVDLGDQYGGWFTQCRNQNAGNNQGAIDCVKNKCNSHFSDKPDLLEGCLFWADWARVADNPTFKFTQVNCPSELTSVSGR